ncbi:unnamed protein product [Ambrosiozyma monospora]|uniref:Unnamed protein product n=1 Tax=Ambrosiozyma monospora TaxID=43982 RepID=A0A9W6T912_AMBMO|nr:unnamed protein product [Ambrosiozyma monospora]
MTTSKHLLVEPCGSAMLALMISGDAVLISSQALEPETERSTSPDPETEIKVESHSSTSFEKNMLASAVEQA